MLITSTILLFLSLLGLFFLEASKSAYQVLEYSRSKEQLRKLKSFGLYCRFQRLLFPNRELEVLLFSLSSVVHILRFVFALASLVLIWQLKPAAIGWEATLIAGLVILLLLSLTIGDFFPRAWANHYPEKALKISAPIASLFLFLFIPVSDLILFLSGKRFAASYVESIAEPVGQMREKIIEMIKEADVSSSADINEKQLLESVTTLRNRIVREIMVPRIDILAISHQTTLREAALLFNEEGYSRIPVYKETIDKVAGVLMYKDLMEIYLQAEDSKDWKLLDQSVNHFLKPIIYVPETSRVSSLLQEFRRQQTHLAIVVDEYGGTEGLVSIEDCLEEIVGEIADEHDEEQVLLYQKSAEGGWIVDARISIAEVTEQFGIKVPQEGDYDTIGGYAFYQAREIPATGTILKCPEFNLEILEATDRLIKRIRIVPHPKKEE